MIKREISVQRFTVVSPDTFDAVIARLDTQIGHPEMQTFRKEIAAAQDLAELERIVLPVTRPHGIMEFYRLDLGDVIRKENGPSAPRILRIVAGNPLIMKEMVKQVPDAGSYAPVTLLVAERADGIHISYDSMVSYLESYGNSDAMRVAQELDAKIIAIMHFAAN